MNALLAKDLRLSLDTLLPWGLIVAGFGAIAAALTRLPDAMAPDALSRLTMEEVFLNTGIVVGATTVAVAAWVAAVVAQGDRIHGAEHLMAALPVSGWRRVASKLAAVLLGAAVPAFVATGCFVASRLVDPVELYGSDRWPSLADFWLPLAATSIAALVGAALGLGVSPIVRGPFRVVAIAMLLGAFGGLLGLFASWLTFDRAAGGLMTYVSQQRELPMKVEFPIDGARNLTATIATMAGVSTIALVALSVGAFALVRPRRPARVLGALAAGLVLSGGAGAVATFMWFDADETIRRTNEWAGWQAQRLDDDKLIRHLDIANRRSLTGASSWPADPIGWAAMIELDNRLRRMEPSVRAGHPLMKAVLAVQDSSTAQRAMWTTSLLPFGPERVERSIDGARRYPEQRQWFLGALIRNGPGVEGRDELLRTQETPRTAAWNAMFDDVARRTLHALQEAYPAQRDAIQALLDEMESPG